MIFPHIPIKIKKSEVIRYLGYKENRTQSSPEIDQMVEDTIADTAYLLNPRGIIKTVDITGKDGDRSLIECDNGAYLIQGANIYKHLEECEKITLMAVTVGPDLDGEIDRFFVEQKPTLAIIYDAIGSDGAERAADHVNQYVINEAKRKGYTTRFRFSPGYGGWTVENQADLIDYLEAGQIGIRVSNMGQMSPRKSVSAVIGWVPDVANNELSQLGIYDQSSTADAINSNAKDSKQKD